MTNSDCLFCGHPLVFSSGTKTRFNGDVKVHGDRVMDIVAYSAIATCKSCGGMYKTEVTELREPQNRNPKFNLPPQGVEAHVKERERLAKIKHLPE